LNSDQFFVAGSIVHLRWAYTFALSSGVPDSQSHGSGHRPCQQQLHVAGARVRRPQQQSSDPRAPSERPDGAWERRTIDVSRRAPGSASFYSWPRAATTTTILVATTHHTRHHGDGAKHRDDGTEPRATRTRGRTEDTPCVRGQGTPAPPCEERLSGHMLTCPGNRPTLAGPGAEPASTWAPAARTGGRDTREAVSAAAWLATVATEMERAARAYG